MWDFRAERVEGSGRLEAHKALSAPTAQCLNARHDDVRLRRRPLVGHLDLHAQLWMGGT